MLTLITDRTAEDVRRANLLTNKGSSMTAQEYAEYISGIKGSYNAEDLNRVESAVEYVLERLKLAGFNKPLEIRTNWKFTDFPTEAEMRRYLNNVRYIRTCLPRTEAPNAPEDMVFFTFEEANDIEKILLAVDKAITNISLAWYYSAEVYAGEV